MDSMPRSRSLRRLYSGSGSSNSNSNNTAPNSTTRPSIAQVMGRHSSSGLNGTAIPSSSASLTDLHPALVHKYRKPGQNLTDAAAQAEWANKRWVWVSDPTLGYVAGWVVSEDGENSQVACVDDKSRTVPTVDLSKMNPPKFDRVEDIADLTFLNEASVVHNLRERYMAEMIYTYSGPFLVAVNPYRSLPIYGQNAINLYKARRREECPPHVFAVAERAWQNMVGEREGQSILITGESGAGKTENTKKVIQYLTAIAAEAIHALPPSGSASSIEEFEAEQRKSQGAQSAGRELENQIIQANPILEAFGNAQTVRNNNSSRFGKFVRIEFTPSGAIAGATIDWYLLEKSRVTARSAKERSFHVFYQLLKGASKDLKKDLLLSGGPEDYEYLKHSKLHVEGVDDHSEWRALEHALRVVGFNAKEQFDLFRVISAILHVGNIVVTGDRSEQAYIRDNSALEKVCHLLGLPVAEFSKALLRPRVKAGREWVTQARSKKQVEDEMGALCKALYEKSFGALVDRINKALDRPINKSTFIGVLDIAGFEIFETNGFEQLCINYTNEKLQQFFNHHMFVLEQEEYARENIDWQFVNFGLDLQPTIDLIESTSPIGILSCLDEECIMPKASDATFTEKLDQLHKSKNRQSATSPLLDQDGSPASPVSKYTPSRFALGFTISHYAGKVEYRTEGWLDKNKDPLNANITSVLAESSQPYVATLFDEYQEEVGLGATGPDGSGLARAPRRVKKGAFRTVAQRHKEQLNTLMSQLRETQPHFVRCIVPNENKKPGQVSVPLVLDQLRCNGVLEGIRIARLGYPNRLPFTEFRQRYEVLTPGIIPNGYMDGRKACHRITEALDLDPAAFRIGLSKIFFKAGVLAELEEQRDELLYDIFTRFQSACRKSICQRRVRKQLNRDASIRTIQRNARIYLQLKAWPWWMLYTKVRPLLAATRSDDELRRRNAELVLAKERAERDLQEKQKLEELKISLESEKRKIQDALESERTLNVDKDGLLARSKEREVELEDELAAMQVDLDTLDSQLERALAAQQAGESLYAELQNAYQDASQHVVDLEARLNSLKANESSAHKELEAKDLELAEIIRSRATLNEKVGDLKRQMAEKEQDYHISQKRLQETLSEVQTRLSHLVRERDGLLKKLQDLEAQHREVQAKLVDLQRGADDARTSLRRQQEEHTAVTSEIRQLKDLRDHLTADLAESKQHASTLQKQVDSAKADAVAQSQASHKVQGELDKLRALIEAKSTEDVKQKEAAALRDSEIADLRGQVGDLSRKLNEDARKSLLENDRLTSDLNKAKQAVGQITATHAEAVRKLEVQNTRLIDLEAQLASTSASKRKVEAELSTLQSRHQDIGAQLRSIQFERDALDKQASITQVQLQDLEDKALQDERARATLQQQLDTLGDRLESEIAKRMRLEAAQRNAHLETETMQTKLLEQDQYIKGLRKELKDKEAELQKSISLQDKTIVEHVHVLEEAKRYTDKQLADTQARLAAMSQYTRTLEKTKTRLQAELEDMTVQNDRERMDERAFEKTMRKLEETAEKAQKRLQQEERMRQVAEQDVARLTAEVQRLRSQPSPTMGSSAMQKSKSAFENIPPADFSNIPTVNGVATKKGLIAELERGAIYNKDGKQDDGLRGRILRELTQANRDLAASMDATLQRSLRR